MKLAEPISTIAPEDALNRLPHIGEHSELQALEKTLAELHARLATNEAKEQTLLTNLNALRSASAESLFADVLIQDPAASFDDMTSVTLAQECRELQQANNAIKRAIRNLNDTGLTTSIEHVKAEFCAAACRAVQPLHHKNARGVISAMLGLYYAQANQQNLHEKLNMKGYARTSHLRNFYVVDLGRIDDTGSWLAAMLRDGKELGMITETERVAIMRGELRQLD